MSYSTFFCVDVDTECGTAFFTSNQKQSSIFVDYFLGTSDYVFKSPTFTRVPPKAFNEMIDQHCISPFRSLTPAGQMKTAGGEPTGASTRARRDFLSPS